MWLISKHNGWQNSNRKLQWLRQVCQLISRCSPPCNPCPCFTIRRRLQARIMTAMLECSLTSRCLSKPQLLQAPIQLIITRRLTAWFRTQWTQMPCKVPMACRELWILCRCRSSKCQEWITPMMLTVSSCNSMLSSQVCLKWWCNQVVTKLNPATPFKARFQ